MQQLVSQRKKQQERRKKKLEHLQLSDNWADSICWGRLCDTTERSWKANKWTLWPWRQIAHARVHPMKTDRETTCCTVFCLFVEIKTFRGRESNQNEKKARKKISCWLCRQSNSCKLGCYWLNPPIKWVMNWISFQLFLLGALLVISSFFCNISHWGFAKKDEAILKDKADTVYFIFLPLTNHIKRPKPAMNWSVLESIACVDKARRHTLFLWHRARFLSRKLPKSITQPQWCTCWHVLHYSERGPSSSFE